MSDMQREKSPREAISGADMTLAAGRNEHVWYQPLADLLGRYHWRGGYLVCLPEYRPDLILAMAYGLRLAHFDFRAKVMLPLGWKAHKLQIEDLERSLSEESAESGLVAQNVEALLAAKAPDERRAWLTGFLKKRWRHAVVVPLVLYGGLVPPGPPRLLSFSIGDVPEQTLLSRFVF